MSPTIFIGIVCVVVPEANVSVFAAALLSSGTTAMKSVPACACAAPLKLASGVATVRYLTVSVCSAVPPPRVTTKLSGVVSEFPSAIFAGVEM